MENRHTFFILFNLVLCVCITYQYGIISYLGVLMIVITHELGHYACAIIKGRDPEFIISSRGDPGVRYGGGRTIFIAAGGVMTNFLFLPVFTGMEIMGVESRIPVLLIIGGSLRDIRDIVNIVKELRKSRRVSIKRCGWRSI